MQENNQPDRTPMEDAIEALCSEKGFLKRRVGYVDGEFFVQEFIDYGPSPSHELPMKTVTLPEEQWHWSPTPEQMRKYNRDYIKAQRLFFKTRRGCAKNALRTLEYLHRWKDPIVSVQDFRKQQELKAAMSNLVSLEDASNEDIENHIHRVNVAVAWYDILTHMPCQIYNKFHNDWRINHLDVRVLTRLEARCIKGNHLIYLYDQEDRSIGSVTNNIGWLRSFTRSMPLEEAERIGVRYYPEYDSKQLDAYGRVLSEDIRFADKNREHVESISETFQKDPRKAVARVGKSYEIIVYHEEYKEDEQ